MKKQKITYQYVRYIGKPLTGVREIPFEMKLTAQLLLDELCFNWNKKRLVSLIDEAIDHKDLDSFMELSETYKDYS